MRDVNDYAALWQMQDAVRTVVEANGYSVWDITQKGQVLLLELTTHIDDEAVSLLCGQFPLTADYEGEGTRGTLITLYI